MATLAVSAAPARSGHSGWWRPPAHPTWYWQLTGTVPRHIPAQLVDVDGFATSAREVADLHASGSRVVCYIDVGTWERWRPDAHRFPAAVLGRGDGWPGERWLDLRRLSVLEPIMSRRLDMCAAKGFDTVEPDNLDPLGNHPGFPLTRTDVLRYATWVARAAHARDMSILQKNGPELAAALEPHFDGVLAEQCHQYAECSAYRPYLEAGKPLLDAEYAARLYPGFCGPDRREGVQGVLFNLALNGRRYRPCWH